MEKDELRFYCKKCDIYYTAIPIKEEYDNPIYGRCERIFAKCPACGLECPEYRKPKPQKASPAPMPMACPPGGCGQCNLM